MMILPHICISQVERMKQEKGYWWASGYWGLLAFQEFSNQVSFGDPYKKKGDKNWELIALVEGWGYFMEWTMAKDLLGWNAIANTLFKDNSFRPLQYQYSSGDKNIFFPNIYAGMFYELNLLGCSYRNMEQSLGTYSLAGYRDNLIRLYPHLQNQITAIITKYENLTF